MTEELQFLRELKNVIGYGRGIDPESQEQVVFAFVTKKEPLSDLANKDRVPDYVNLEQRDELVLTDVLESDFTLQPGPWDIHTETEADRRGRFDPIIGGIKIHAEKSKGTGSIGFPAVDTEGDTLVCLTNEHVVDPNEPGDAVFQPTKETGKKIGTLLERSYREEQDPVTTDSALIALDEPSSPHILNIGKIHGFVEAEEHEVMQKSGYRTGYDNGYIISIDSSVDVKVDEDEEGNAIRKTYEPILVATATSAGGDSGCAWTVKRDGKNHGVGLHFAGGTLSAAIPIQSILEEHGELEPVGDRSRTTGLDRLSDWLRRRIR